MLLNCVVQDEGSIRDSYYYYIVNNQLNINYLCMFLFLFFLYMLTSYLKPYSGSSFQAELLAVSSLYLLQQVTSHQLDSQKVFVDINDQIHTKTINGTMWNALLRQSSCHLTLPDLCS